MRVLQLCSAFAYSGPAPAMLALAQDLAARGHDVTLGHDTLRPNGNEHEEGMGPRAAATGLAVADDLALSTQAGPLTWWRDRKRLAQRMAHTDVVHVHFSHDHALVASIPRSASGPVVVRTIHSPRSLRRRLGQAALLARADALVVHAQRDVQRVHQGLSLTGARVAVVPGPVDVDRFTAHNRAARRARFCAQHGLADQAPVAVMVAIFQQGRGHDTLLRCWPRVVARVPGAQLLLVGLGELRQGCMAQVATEKVTGVHFAGYLVDDLADAYAAADASVLLAVGNDGYGRAVLESMACGTPAVVADIAAVADVVNGAGVGAVVDGQGGLEEALVAALTRSPQQAQADAEQARQYVERAHTQAVVTQAHVSLYEELLADRRRA